MAAKRRSRKGRGEGGRACRPLCSPPTGCGLRPCSQRSAWNGPAFCQSKPATYHLKLDSSSSLPAP